MTTQQSQEDSLRRDFLNEEVSGILFIRNYMELQCDNKRIQFFAYPTIHTAEGVFRFGDRGVCQNFIDLIGQVIVEITSEEGVRSRFVFDSGLVVEVRRKDSPTGETFATVVPPDGFAEYY